MKRKLVKQGAATLMVSLPAGWLRKFNLGKGDEVDVEESGDTLVVAKKGVKGKKELEIEITKDTETWLRTIMVNAYRQGYDLVRARFSSAKQFNELKRALKSYVLGYEITKKGKDFCVVESITDPAPEQFDAVMNKIFFSIKELAELTKERLEGKKPEEDYAEIGARIHKYSSFCRRIVSKRKKDVKNPHLFWTFHALLVHAQRDLHHLNRFLDREKTKASKQAIEMLDSISEIVGLLSKGYSKKDTKFLEEIHAIEKEIVYRKGYSLISSKKGKESIIVHHLLDSARNFYLASSPLMGLILGQRALP